MIKIISSEVNASKLNEYYNWVVDEWGTVDSFDKVKNGLELPAPLLALNEGTLVGGLSFTVYQSPSGSGMALWINTVYIHENSRGFGIASRLILKAEEVSRKFCRELFVYTDKPDLYRKLGWRVVEEGEENTVLMKEV